MLYSSHSCMIFCFCSFLLLFSVLGMPFFLVQFVSLILLKCHILHKAFPDHHNEKWYLHLWASKVYCTPLTCPLLTIALIVISSYNLFFFGRKGALIALLWGRWAMVKGDSFPYSLILVFPWMVSSDSLSLWQVHNLPGSVVVVEADLYDPYKSTW